MAELVIQIGPRTGQQTRYEKSTANNISIGRSFSNDVILSDPYVAAEQLRIVQTEGKYFLIIQDNTNPVFVNGVPPKLQKIDLKSGDRINIGRTQIRVFTTDHVTEPTRKLVFSNWFYQSPWRSWIPWIVLCVVAVAIGLSEYLQSYDEINWQQIASSCLVGVFGLYLWAVVWSIIGKVFRHQSQLLIQLTVTGLVYIVAMIMEFMLGPLEYISNSFLLGNIYQWLFAAIILTLLLYVNLSIATNIRKPHQMALLISLVLMMFLFGVYKLDEDEFQWQPEYSQSLAPPIFKWHSDVQVDDYILGYQSLFEQLQEQRDQD